MKFPFFLVMPVHGFSVKVADHTNPLPFRRGGYGPGTCSDDPRVSQLGPTDNTCCVDSDSCDNNAMSPSRISRRY